MDATRPIAAAALLAALAAGGCGSLGVPVDTSLRNVERRVPVVLVPGITAARLRDPDSGRLVWGNGRSVFAPHDGGYAVALPIDPDAAAEQRLELAGVIDRIRLGPIVKKVYGPIIRLLEANGYRRGDLEAPRPEDSFFLFAYDWRDGNVDSAVRLAARLERLRRVRGDERLPVVLICQSNGAHICRWFAKHGGATIEQAEAGLSGPPASVELRKLILVSTANGGSLRNLQWLLRGRRYFPVLGRRWRPEAVFTVRAIFEDLPVYRDDLFLDGSGRLLAVDLFDVESWRRYGWSIFDSKVRRRIEASGRDDLFGDHAARVAFLTRALDRARRFHRQLGREMDGLGSTRYYLVQNLEAETPQRAVLTRHGNGWRTHFLGDRWLRRRPRLRELATTDGDGHAAGESQLWLSSQERTLLARAPAYIEGPHFELILDPETQRKLLAYLREPAVRPVLATGTR